ncbi:MAG: tetratricopeptide repeat protein [Paracoccaceae bacterium]
MSESDSFIHEVTEEVRRDKLFALMRKYGWIGILAVMLIVGGAAWNEYRKAQAAADAQAFGDGLTAALEAEDPAARAAALAALGEDTPRAAIADFLAADAAAQAGDTAAALKLLDEIAGRADAGPAYTQLAKLKRVMLAGADMPAADRDAALSELAQPGAPYRALAMEQQALALVEQGDRAGALALFKALLDEAQMTAGLRQRVSQMIVALGGTLDAA